MDSIELATDACRTGLTVAMQVTLPILAVGLIMGLVVSIAQAVTQIQEQTLSFIPKIFAMVAVLFLLLPWILSVITAYTQNVLENLTVSVLSSW